MDALANDFPTDAEGRENAEAQKLHEVLEGAQKAAHDALCDSFNTPTAMASISDIISIYNAADKRSISKDLTLAIAKWVSSMVNIFGLNGNVLADEPAIGWSGISIPEEAKPFIYLLSSMRDDLRKKAKSQDGLTFGEILAIKDEASVGVISTHVKSPYTETVSRFVFDLDATVKSDNLAKDVLKLCDRLRDTYLWDLDIYLQDRDDDRPALIRPVTRELRAAKQERQDRESQRQQAKVDREKEAAAKAERGRLSHLEMFRTSEYSAWDTDGLPVRDAEGDEITKSKAKKLRKDWERQKKLHEVWLKSNG